MKSLIAIYIAAIISGFTAYSYANSVINSLVVKPVQTQNVQSTLTVSSLRPESRLYTVYQEQGGNRQHIQVTTSNTVAPQPATISIQGNQEDSDTLQPALGYGSLGWTLE
jgi:hypothetical protein